MKDDQLNAPQRELDVFRFVVDDEAVDAAPVHGVARTPKRLTRLRMFRKVSLLGVVGPVQSAIAGLGSAMRRVVRAPVLLPALGVIGALTIVVFGIIAFARFEHSQRQAAAETTPPSSMPSPVAASPRAQQIHIRAGALIRTAVDRTSTAAPPFNGYLYDLPRSQAFARSWRSVLARLPAGERAGNPWLASLETTAAPNQAIETLSGERYILAWGCDPGQCAARSVQISYNVSTSAVAARLSLNGVRHTLGSTAVDDRATLLAQMACERIGLAERFPLRASDVETADRYIASASLE